MATRLPYYTSEGDIYSQLMAQFAQEQQPYYSAAPFGFGVLGGYDPGLYARTSPTRDYYSGLLGGGYGADSMGVNNTASGLVDANSLTGGLLAALIGQENQAAVDNVGSMLADQATIDGINAALDIGFSGQAGIADAAAAGMAAADGVGASGIGDGSVGSIGDGIGASAAADAVGVAGGDGGGGGGGGGKIICTKLHELGKMPREIYEADQAFGEILVRMHPETYYGYACWAQTVVRWMSRDDIIGKSVVAIAHSLATPWSIAMAEQMGVNVKSNWFGRFLMKRGLQLCSIIGKVKKDRSVQYV